MRLIKVVLVSLVTVGLLLVPIATPASAAGQVGHLACVDDDHIDPGGTATPEVTCPPATAARNGSEIVESAVSVPPVTAASGSADPAVVELPNSGATSTLVIAGLAALLVLSGSALLYFQNRPRRARD